ncbi:MAG TPA: phosphopantetheine-binding protein [Bacillota bacterium]|jgi:acyl carrier protein|nr:acyl carrier protein [Clostridiaceae bacterium]HPY64050.1 phosphopantetheine-binding protein [Bacillota bacterium]HQC47975.1 phosphopantetheine-binding protein [Bacillota bacterium]
MIFTRMQKVLRDFAFTEVDMSKATMSASLMGDLRLSSLSLILLVCDLEEEFDIEIPHEDLYGLETLGDVHAYLCGRFDRNE